jgi:hypothetical protein
MSRHKITAIIQLLRCNLGSEEFEVMHVEGDSKPKA